ncbi:ATP-binding protein [Allochromatium humboldtianum]|uniref:ATP-binding protein n=1 Tax=Allochromatium humboldtianum TaxID=504901 RepID=A0A850R6G2_9GAMM|nr:ATP-binding protein [Allochromatium humboldtianum]NVZ10289.1 ATP-binding protein [Allochromatium humboldtianum]
MTQPRRQLPIGIQTFAKIREGEYYYVDKTPAAWRLAQTSGYYFLSRPRRFGKSLFLDTLKELFEGNEPLFRGLDIHPRWDWSTRHAVIHISFGAGVLQTRAELDRRILDILRVNQERLGLTCPDSQDVAGCFAELIRLAHAHTGRRVAVLIDEYDKPILDNIADSDTALVMREGLKNLYSVIKDADAHLRFVFLTGVSKFSKVSLFSGLNNLEDITLTPAYSALCGYTDADVDTVFAPELDGLDRDEIRRWYNGYNWTGESVYNPFNLLLLFRNRRFQPWWFETGTPAFLVKLLARNGFFTPDLARLRTGLEILSTFDVDRIAPEALLFQTGYLTIHKAEEPLLGHWVYTLGYPNHEVASSLNAALLSEYTDDPSRSFAHRLRLLDLLQANDLAGLKALFQSFFAGIPSDWYRNNPIARYEGYYASVFYSYFAALGLEIRLEDATNWGRIDMTVLFNGHIYLFEFKVVELAPKGLALQQIKDRGYADKYRTEGGLIHLIGVEFSRETRTVVGFEVETLT